jgi:hypothetical protein
MRSVPGGARLAPVAALLLLLPSVGLAEGWGINLSYDWGKGQVEDDVANVTRRIESTILGAGITYDPNVAQDRLINYRVDVNFEYLSQTYDGDLPVRGLGMGVNQALGFGVLRNRHWRLWIAPSMRLSVAELTPKGGGDQSFWDFEFGGGPMIGFNQNIGNRFAASITGGYQYLLHLTESGTPGTNFIGGQHRVFAGLTFLYRSADDVFDGRAEPTHH